MSNNSCLIPTTLVSSNHQAFLTLAIGSLSLCGGIALVAIGVWGGWVLCILAVPALLLYHYTPLSSLMITFGGISVTHLGRTSSFTWKDVEGFSIEKFNWKKLVVIQLSRAAILRGVENNIFLMHVTDQEGDCRYFIPDNYGYSAEELREHLGLWSKQ